MKFTTLQSTAMLTIFCIAQTGCAVFKPYVGQKAPFDIQSVPNKVSYSDAVSNAGKLSKEILDKQTELHQFDFWSGTVLIGAGLATAGLGVYGASTDAILGTALGAGAIVGARSYVPIKARQDIYSIAIGSIGDAVEKSKSIATNGVPSGAVGDSLSRFNGRLASPAPGPGGAALPAAQMAQMAQASRVLSAPTRHFSDRYAVASKKASEFLSAVANYNGDANRGAILMAELRAIIFVANKALVNEVLDPSGALEKALALINKQRDELKAKKEEAERALDRAEDAQSLAVGFGEVEMAAPVDSALLREFKAAAEATKIDLEDLRSSVTRVSLD